MRQLSGLDAEFLSMESAQVFAHVGSVTVLDPSTAPQPLTLSSLTTLIAARMHLVPLFSRVLAPVPFGLDQPYWIDGAAPELDYHVRELALPAPGDEHQLAVEIARLHAIPLDRSRPLWQAYLITGLLGGRAAVYSKIHHAALDGVSGDEVLNALMDASPEQRVVEPATEPVEHPPGDLSLLMHSARSGLGQPVRAVRIGVGLLRSAAGLSLAAAERVPAVERLRHPGDVAQHPGLRAPNTPFTPRSRRSGGWPSP